MVPEPIPIASREFDTLIREYSCLVEIPMLALLPARSFALWPAGFPVYASIMLFPHHSASKSASGLMLLTRCLPRFSSGLSNMTATLGSFYWLGFETSGLSPDKKRLAWLGAQRLTRLPLLDSKIV
jgi:hypothetical protein